jgi:hypothetical protein
MIMIYLIDNKESGLKQLRTAERATERAIHGRNPYP